MREYKDGKTGAFPEEVYCCYESHVQLNVAKEQ